MPLEVCPHCGGDLTGFADGRAGWWSFRVRLYDMQMNKTEPMVDSDADLEPDQPGAEVARGLFRVMQEAAAAAVDFHGGGALRGLGGDVIEKKIRGSRSTFSRCNGRATIRIPYDTADSFQDRPGTERYMIRIDILKANGPAA